MNIPFIDLKRQYSEVKDQVLSRIHTVLEHGQYIMGPEVKECETALSKFTGSKYSLTCSNGTDALILSLMALDIGPGDEVIVPGFSFIATAESVLLVGATPVFVDIDSQTFNIDVELIEDKITEKTKAIMPVSLFGQVPDCSAINKIAEKHQLHVIEDAAQSFGATQNQKRSCNLTEISCTSFFPAKPLGCYGDGGAVFTNDDSLYEKLLSLRIHGQDETHRYLHPNIGINGRMDTLQCAILIEKLGLFSGELEKRQVVANRYENLLSDVEELETPQVAGDNTSAWAQYTLRTRQRDELRQHLQQKGIPAVVYYPKPMYAHPPYEKYANEQKFPECERACREVLSLPMHPYLEEGVQETICREIRDFYR